MVRLNELTCVPFPDTPLYSWTRVAAYPGPAGNGRPSHYLAVAPVGG
jgi:hypothetical protein